ncbi:MAG: helix-hairpin-helix domain-containing protein [Eubacterium sp.]|nr:helix-hairpin-helix domain-containing protein [Eubacterium sp.]
MGPTRRKALMRRYDSLDAIAGATVEELMEMPEINEASAREIVAFFAKGGNGKG